MASFLVLDTKTFSFHYIKILSVYLFVYEPPAYPYTFSHSPIGSKTMCLSFQEWNEHSHYFSSERSRRNSLMRPMICELFKKVVTLLNVSSLSTYLTTVLKRFITLHNVKILSGTRWNFRLGGGCPVYIPLCIVRR